MENKTTETADAKEYKGHKWVCDETHSRQYWGCFTCEMIRLPIDLAGK